jgi:DNA-binding MarR family transcriptional regulator
MITMHSSCLPHERKPCPGKIAKHFVAGSARNSLQLANELDIDWKTIDNHIEILTRYGLVEEKMVVGTAKYYIVTEHGRRVLSLLESEYCAKLTLRPKHFNWFYKKLAYVRPGSIEIPGCF